MVCGGIGRGSHIAASSVHNQRIERLWRDVFRCVCSTYHELFYSMEAIGILDPDDDLDLFVLRCVYLLRVNKSVAEFARAWNLHPIRTERNWSPRQIMMNSMIREIYVYEDMEIPLHLPSTGMVFSMRLCTSIRISASISLRKGHLNPQAHKTQRLNRYLRC